MKTPLYLSLIYFFSACLLAAYFVFAWIAPDHKGNITLDVIQYTCLVSAIILMTLSTMMNYIIGGYIFKSYEELVKKTLDKYLGKLNKDKFTQRGLQWYVVPNHYWIELRVLEGRGRRKSMPGEELFDPSSSVIEEVVAFEDEGERKAPVPNFEESKKEVAIELKDLDKNSKKEPEKKSTKSIRSPLDTKTGSLNNEPVNKENSSSPPDYIREDPLKLEDLDDIEQEDSKDQPRRTPKNTRLNSENGTVRLTQNLLSKGTGEQFEQEDAIEKVPLEKKVFST